MKPLILGTRGSPLALWQSEWVRKCLRETAGVECQIERIQTSGDKKQTGPLSANGGKGLFVKELEESLLEGRIDLAVHSLKDVPTVLLPGFDLPVFMPRADPRDCLVSRPEIAHLADLSPGARVGSCSPRRVAQALNLIPGLDISDLRGNVATRLEKVRSGELDATFLAKAGLDRLEMSDSDWIHPLAPETMVPAAGQGIVAIEIRAGREDLRELLAEALDDSEARAAALAERAVVRHLEGNCVSPIGAHARISQGTLDLTAMVGDVRGETVLRESVTGHCEEAEQLGRQAAERLKGRGAARLIQPE
jgi:hydroxymethylbilane synthase